MIRVETNVVLKYFEPVDAFIKVRLFTEAEVRNLLRNARITGRRTYIDLVLNACVVDLAQIDPVHAEKLYDVVAELNPAMDIRRVVIPVAPSPSNEIHLLDEPAPAPVRDFQKLRDMEDELARRVIGQERAIASVSRAVKKAMTGLRDPERPMATFFFVGQTGVGKTELAKALTVYLFSDPGRMLRVDCSEYQLPHEVAKLTGAPPGYVGHDQGGVLSEGMRSRDSAVVLFDEIEKGDAKVHDVLLQLMDEGFVTDNKGRRVPFGNALLVLTSNVGAEEIAALKQRIGFGDPARREPDRETVLEETLSSLKTRFKPEFVNRLTEVVLFEPIGIEECERIATRFLEEVRRHAQGVPLTVVFANGVSSLLAEMGYAPACGAREVRRTVEREVEGRLSEMLVGGQLHPGDRVVVRVRRDRLDFAKN
jgi:ATP-dependent Clp protease ATP-binding subunit ClpC